MKDPLAAVEHVFAQALTIHYSSLRKKFPYLQFFWYVFSTFGKYGPFLNTDPFYAVHTSTEKGKVGGATLSEHRRCHTDVKGK